MCGCFLASEERLPSREVVCAKVFLLERKSIGAVEYDMHFGMETTASAAGTMLTWAIDIVVGIGAESD